MKLVAYLFIFSSLNSHALTIDKCGDFLFRGKVIKNSKELGYIFRVNANTKSEYNLKIPVEMEQKVAPYVDEYTELSATLLSKLASTNGTLNKIGKIKKIPIDPIRLNSKTVKLIKEVKCQ